MKKSVLVICVVFVASIMFSGCAAMFKMNKGVTLNGNVPAKAYYNGKFRGNVPGKIKVTKMSWKKENNILEIKADGYAPFKIEVPTKFSVCNLIIDDVFCFILGSSKVPKIKSFNYELKKD